MTNTQQLGNAKAFLIKQVLAAAAKQQGDEVVAEANQADLVIALGGAPNNGALQGKKLFVAEMENAFNAPEATLKQAQAEAVEYQPAENKSAVQNAPDFSNQTKNIVAVTACPTGVAHTFMSAEAIAEYAKKQGWNVKVETRGQVGSSN
ncbi:PTS fructose transporter subunit EIIBC, partial [Avibacterium avium]